MNGERFSGNPPPEPSKKPPIERVPDPEYNESRRFLEDFQQRDVSNITDFASLQTHMQGVGKALRDVVVNNSTYKEERQGQGLTVAVKQMNKEIRGTDDNDGKLTGTTTNEAVTIHKRDLQDGVSDIYFIDVPLADVFDADADLPLEAGIPDKENPLETTFIVPTDEPTNSELQREYAKVLHHTVNDILDVTKEAKA